MTQLSRHLLAYLDGSRSRSDLLDIMIQSATQGLLAVSQEGQPVEEPARQRSILAEELAHLLQQLMRAALLVG
jgi:methyltransferase-like protein